MTNTAHENTMFFKVTMSNEQIPLIGKPIQQAVLGLFDHTLCGLNGSTCKAVSAYLKNGSNRTGPYLSNVWPGMAHKLGELVVPAGFAVSRVDALCCESCQRVSLY